MRTAIIKQLFILAVTVIGICTSARAELLPFTNRIFTPYGGAAVITGTSTANKMIQVSPATGAFVDALVTDRITFGVDLQYPGYVATDMNVEINVELKRYNQGGTLTNTDNIPMIIEYHPFNSTQYLDHVSMSYTGAYKLEFKITSVKVNGVTTTTLPAHLYVDGEIFVERYKTFSSPSTPISFIAAATPNIDQDCDGKQDLKRITWNQTAGVEEYQLEWTYINDYDASGGNMSPALLNYNFKYNSTRVSIVGDNYYDLSLIYDKGWLVYRLRGIGVNSSNPSQQIVGAWNLAESGNVGAVGSLNKFQILSTNVHQNNLNWQYSARYAEQGKRKEVISYYDGSLRGRQTVTRISSDNNAIIGETVYDHQGRPAVEVLPVPAKDPNSCSVPEVGSSLKFYPSFNQNSDGFAYSRDDFEIPEDCESMADGMNTGSGASNYYSPQNPNQAGAQAFVPDAQLYPFSQTVYTPDNTGRVRKQGGVGPEFQIGSGHETEYLYGRPEQEELDRLFGSEMGYASHYKKNVVIDAHRQATVSYLNQEGKIIATALAGDNPDNMLGIPSETAVASPLSINALGANNENNGLNNVGDTRTLSTQLTVAAASDFDFQYILSIPPLNDPCLPGICIDCVYDLTIELVDECGQNLFPDSLQDRLTGFYEGNEEDGYVFHNNCDDFSFVVEDLTVHLEVGTYSLNKILTVNEAAREAYIAMYLDTSLNDCLKTLYDFKIKSLGDVDTTGCGMTCEECLQELGTLEDFVALGQGTASDYYARQEDCEKLCNGGKISFCEVAYTMLKMDMSPGGQYAQHTNTAGTFDPNNFPLSILSSVNQLPKNLNTSGAAVQTAFWRLPRYVDENGTVHNEYQDENGDRSRIPVSFDGTIWSPAVLNTSQIMTDAGSGVTYIYPENLADVNDFVLKFKLSWAQSLVTYHPEYCYYESCIEGSKPKVNGDIFTSQKFDDLLLESSTLTGAVDNGFLIAGGGGYTLTNWFVPTGGNPASDVTAWDPFIYRSSYFVTTDCGDFGAELITKFNNYQTINGVTYSMAEIAAVSARAGIFTGQTLDPSYFAFGSGTLLGGATPPSVLLAEWNNLQAFYRSAKQQLQQQRSNCKAIKECKAYNGCIGDDGYAPVAEGMVNLWGGLTPFYASPYFDHQQPCAAWTKDLYAYKSRRFADESDVPIQTANQAAYQLYMQTGQCPVTFTLQTFLNKMAVDQNIDASGLNLNALGEFTSMFLAENNFYMPPVPALTYNASVGSNTVTADWVDGSSATYATLTLSLPVGSPLTWDDLSGIINVDATSPNAFNAQGIYFDGTMNTTVALSGTLSIFNLEDCQFEQDCSSNQLAKDLTILFNTLIMNGELTTTSTADLANWPYMVVMTPVISGPGTGYNRYEYNATTHQMHMYNTAAPTEGLYITFNSATPSSFNWADLSTAMSFDLIVSSELNTFDVVAHLPASDVTLHGSSIRVLNGESFGTPLGECQLPTQIECMSPQHEAFEQLEDLLIDVLLNQPFTPSTSVNIFASAEISPAITQFLHPSVTSSTSNYTSDGTGASLRIYLGDCDITLTTTNTGSGAYGLDYLTSITDFSVEGTPDANGNYTYFSFTGTFEYAGTTSTQTVQGRSCIELKQCINCPPDPITPLQGGRAARTAQAGNGEGTVYAKASKTGTNGVQKAQAVDCKTAYSDYVKCVENFNTWASENSYFTISAMDYQDFVDKGFCECTEKYCAILEGIMKDKNRPRDRKDFEALIDMNKICASDCKNAYDSYVACVENYNTWASNEGYFNVTLASYEDFVDKGFCDCADKFCALLERIMNDRNRPQDRNDFEELVNMNVVCAELEGCDAAYQQYLDCISTFETWANAEGFRYTIATVYSYQDFRYKYGFCFCADEFCARLNNIMTGLTDIQSQQNMDTYLDFKKFCVSRPPCTPEVSTGLPIVTPDVTIVDNCVEMALNQAVFDAQLNYQHYLDSIRTVLIERYNAHCMGNELGETFAYSYDDKMYHFTLYYYDQAGNLIKTIPPEGVEKLDFAANPTLPGKINQDRIAHTKTVFTNHRLATRYEYNSLNQLVAEATPDADLMNIFELTLPSGLSSKLETSQIQMVTNSIGFLTGKVGTRGYVYRTDDGGATWKQINVIGADLKKVQMLSATLGFAIGEAGTVLQTNDGGMNWDLVYTWGTAGDGMIKDLNDMAFVSTGGTNYTGYIVGEGNAVIRAVVTSAVPAFTVFTTGLSGTAATSVTGAATDGTNFFITVNNPSGNLTEGLVYTTPLTSPTTWTLNAAFNVGELTDVDFYETTGSKAYAAGVDGRLYRNVNAVNSTNSTRWIVVPTANMTYPIRAIRFFNETQGIALMETAVGVKSLMRTVDGGFNWTQVSNGNFNSLSKVNGGLVMAVGKAGRIEVLVASADPAVANIVIVPQSPTLDFTAGWADKEVVGSSSVLRIMVAATNNNVYYTDNGFGATPVWQTTSGIAGTLGSQNIVEIEAKRLTSSGNYIAGVVRTANNKIYGLGKATSATTVSVGALSGTSTDVFPSMALDFAGNRVFVHDNTTSKIHFVNLAAALPTACNATATTISAANQVVAIAYITDQYLGVNATGNIHAVGLTGTTIAYQFSQLNRVSPGALYDVEYANPGTPSFTVVGADGQYFKKSSWFAATYWDRVNTGFNGDIYKVKTTTSGIYVAGSNGLFRKGTIASNVMTSASIGLTNGLTAEQSLAGIALNDIDFRGTRMYVVGGNGTVLYTADFTTTAFTKIQQGAANLYGVGFKTATNQAFAVGLGARMHELSGASFILKTQLFIAAAKDVHFSNVNNGTMLADNFTIRTTQDGGASWHIVKPTSLQPPTGTPAKVWTIDGHYSLVLGAATNPFKVNDNVLTLATTITGLGSVTEVVKGATANTLYTGSSTQLAKIVVGAAPGYSLTKTNLVAPGIAASGMHVFDNGDYAVVGGTTFKYYKASNALHFTATIAGATINDLYFHDHINGVLVGNNGVYYRTANQVVGTDGYLTSANTTMWVAETALYTLPNDPYQVDAATEVNIKAIAFATPTDGIFGGNYNSGFADYANPMRCYVRRVYNPVSRYTARFFYDKLGRLIVSQNSRQYAASPKKKYSYVLYDNLGRAIESGEKTENPDNSANLFSQIFGAQIGGHANPLAVDYNRFAYWAQGGGARNEVTKTYYDKMTITTGLPATFTAAIDPNTQFQRIAQVTYEETFDNNDQTFDHATHYNYDIHGNVKNLLQDNRKMAITYTTLAGQRFKQIDYAYDVISGNVHRVSVESGKRDQWHHAYIYDADNRITDVYTTKETPLLSTTTSIEARETELLNNENWERDARYFYYDHGPMARKELGSQLQGMDYIYNLQGWVKGVNSTTLKESKDPGNDNEGLSVNYPFAKDAMGFSLHYFDNDYSAIKSTKNGAGSYAADILGSDLTANSFDLFSGNIKAMQTAITDPSTYAVKPLGTAYKYDQLSRLRESRSFANVNLTTNDWPNPTTYNNMYYNEFIYDAMGNILTQKRRDDAGTLIDDLSYKYQYNTSSQLMRNRLYHVKDAQTNATLFTDDIDDQDSPGPAFVPATLANANYTYDQEGRLISDKQEKIDQIVWRADGKVKQVLRTSASATKKVLFDYDATGNRIAKHVYNNGTGVLEKSTYYILDGMGLLMNTYEQEVVSSVTTYKLVERQMYGSKRLGLSTVKVDMLAATFVSNPLNHIQGLKFFEMTNHLGNVLTVIKDKVTPLDATGDNVVDGHRVFIANARDYSPFGVILKGRNMVVDEYRFGFNGMEKDDEIKSAAIGNSYDYGSRFYDPRVGRWLSGDMRERDYPSNSTYGYVANNPIYFVDIDGNVIWDPVAKKEVVYDAEAKKFTYADKTELSADYQKQANKTLTSLAGSAEGRALIEKMRTHETKIIIDETRTDKLQVNNNSTPPNAVNEGLSMNKKTGLFKEVLVVPNIAQIEQSVKDAPEGPSFDEKILGTLFVEFSHFGTADQISMEQGSIDIYENSENFAKAYNSMMNQAIATMIAYRTEQGKTVDKSVFTMYEKFKAALNGDKKPVGEQIKLTEENQAVYDKLQKEGE